MRDWLTIELVLAVLLVTSFTCVGLLALWAATSPRHWFIRTAALLAAVSPLLIIPAYELFMLFVLQSMVIATAVSTYRAIAAHCTEKHRSDRSINGPVSRSLRYSLSTVMLLTLLAAIATAVAMKLPQLNVHAWSSIALNALAGAIAVLLGGWIYKNRRGLVVWPSAMLLAVAIGAAPAFTDWLFLSLVSTWESWPPEPSLRLFGTAMDDRPVVAWFFIPPLVALCTTLALFAVAIPQVSTSYLETGPTGLPRRRRRPAPLKSAMTVIMIAAFPAFVLSELLFPDPIPDTVIPPDNAYGDFIAAGKIAESTRFDGSIDFETASIEQVATEVKRCDAMYATVQSAVDKPCIVPVDYSFSAGNLPMEHFTSFRAIARALYGKAIVAEAKKEYVRAAEAMRQVIAFGYAIRRGGLFVDALVGMGCTSFGTGPLYYVREKLPPAEIDHSIRLLVELDSSAESFEEIWQRDRVWTQRSCGWRGHLEQLLGEIVDHTDDLIFISSDEYPKHCLSEQAAIRLLIVELALARFHQDNGRWPESLETLVPSYLPSIPVDPFDHDGQPLRYRPAAHAYVLYSVGPNGDDDHGAPPDVDDLRMLPDTGDLRLDRYFADDMDSEGPREGDDSN